MTFFPKRRKRERMGVRQPSQVRSPSHLAWVRGRMCSIAGKHTCSGKSEAAHCRSMTDGATGMKPGDNWVLPLCSAAHHEQHQIGEEAFERKYRISMRGLAQDTWQASPHRPRIVPTRSPGPDR